MKHFFPLTILKTLYYSTFHCYLTYCPSILSCSSNKNIDRISKLQKKAIRIITLSSYNAHTEPLFKKLLIVPFDKIIYQSNLQIIHSIYHNYSSSSLSEIFTRNIDRPADYELRNNDDFSIPRVKYEYLKRFPLYNLPKIWNTANGYKYLANPTFFRSALKTDLLGLSVDDEVLARFENFPYPEFE